MTAQQQIQSDAAEGRGDDRGGLAAVVATALREFLQLTGVAGEAVTGARPEDDGWALLVDVTELARVPDTTSVMATYRIDVDRDGHLRSYERLRRFMRSQTDQS